MTPCAQSFGYVSVPFVFRTLLCPSLQVEGMATVAAKPLCQTVACSIGEPLPGTWSWGCAVKFQEKPEKERRRIMNGVWSQAEIATSSHLSSHRELGGKSGLSVAVIDRSPRHRELAEVLFGVDLACNDNGSLMVFEPCNRRTLWPSLAPC